MTLILYNINSVYRTSFQGPLKYFETNYNPETRRNDEVKIVDWDFVCGIYDFTSVKLVP
jgi:hypothetical protein